MHKIRRYKKNPILFLESASQKLSYSLNPYELRFNLYSCELIHHTSNIREGMHQYSIAKSKNNIT